MNLQVRDMSCGHYSAAIEKAVTAAGGTARCDLQNRTISVDRLDPDRAFGVIRAAGFTPEAD